MAKRSIKNTMRHTPWCKLELRDSYYAFSSYRCLCFMKVKVPDESGSSAHYVLFKFILVEISPDRWRISGVRQIEGYLCQVWHIPQTRRVFRPPVRLLEELWGVTRTESFIPFAR